MSYQSGSKVSDWKKANITPIFKKGSKHSPANYRPISLTSIIIKTLERLIHIKVLDFRSEHNKLSDSQHGFRPGHNCQAQLLEAAHQWAENIDHKYSTDVIFLEISKAFDSVPHKGLLLKLDNIGIRGSLLRWIDSFLKNRQQRVVINNTSSSWETVTSGIPQGSILGPLLFLFLVYVNDIGNGITSTTKLFADDCTLYRRVNSAQDARCLQQDINHLFTWSQNWQLKFNISKCKVIQISNKKLGIPYTYNINLFCVCV